MAPLQNGHPSQVKLFLIGLLALPIIGLYLLVSLPFFIYRWLMSQIVVPFYRPDLGRILDGFSFGLSLEFYDRTPAPFFKSAIVSKNVSLGTIPLSEFVEAFKERVLLATTRTSHRKDLMYPELQQRPTPWMGLMFWKRVKKFNLADYFHLHKIEETGNDSDSERFLVRIMEELLNKPFPPDRSPWEVHLIHNYKNTLVSGKHGSKMNVILIRLHHCLADGYSVVKLVAEDLLKTSKTDFRIVPPSPKVNTHPLQTGSQIGRSSIKDALKLPFQLLQDLGYVLWIGKLRVVTPWHANPNEKVNQPVLYARSNPIPIQMVKNIKNHFGVRFTSVLLSILSKGVSQNFKKNGKPIDKCPVLVVQPLPNHPMGSFTNHLTLAYLDIYTDPELNPLERLRLTERSFAEQKNSAMRPAIVLYLMKIFCSHIAPVTKLLMKNKAFATGLSNFAAPVGTCEFNGRKFVDFGFTTGTHRGVVGVAFTVFSFNGHIRIGATAESCVMSKDELNDLMQSINGELKDLNRDSVNITGLSN